MLGTGEKGRYLLAATFGNVHGVYKPGNVKLRPEILKEIQDAVAAKVGKDKPFDLVFHGGSGSALEEIREALSYGVVKMNVDTDTQYAFTRPIADHMFTNYDGVLKIDGEVGNKKAYDPRSYLKAAEVGMAARVTEACEALQSAGTSQALAAMTHFGNLLAPPTLLPDDPAVALLAAGDDPTAVAAAHPASSAAWATLAEAALAAGRPIEAYAYARTGYHRGLDALRRAGWKGQGPVPWAHEPNRGFLRAVHALGLAASAINETDEAARCAQLLRRQRPRSHGAPSWLPRRRLAGTTPLTRARTCYGAKLRPERGAVRRWPR